MNKFKTFLDTVHGYITVPENFCDLLIDTPNFQRLRRIEQLSSRSLYPCARHDRFVHSLGVYHIGKKFITSLKQKYKDIDNSLEKTFLIACLLHDVGHSPFSHTLEEQFGTIDDLFNVYKTVLGNTQEKDELDKVDIAYSDVKQHEILSALLCITTYYDSIKELGGSPALVGRMIMGLTYDECDKSLENCFISLLHGDVIDADKFDYICRDRWASGYQSNSVDIERIIRSVILVPKDGKYQIAYSKDALYEIYALVENRNFQQNWIFKHHQVVYEQTIFKRCVKSLVECLKSENCNLTPATLFNYKSFYGEVEVCPSTNVYMLSDDDIIYLLKTHRKQIPCFDEWMSRQYKYTPIWKTYSEMIALMNKEISDKIMTDKGSIYDEIVKHIKKTFGINAFACDGTPRIKCIEKGQVYIYFGDEHMVDFTQLGMPEQHNDYKDRSFKYIFVEKSLFSSEYNVKKEDVIESIKFFSNRYN